MFICKLTKTVSEPREKPVRVVLSTRPARYTVVGTPDDPDEVRIFHGTEIVEEVDARLIAVDAEKAARLAARKPFNLLPFMGPAATRFEHARRCKKQLDECPSCQENVRYFATLPLNVLSRITEEKRWS